ncbi:odorant receptor 131-2-like [Clarias gariepinus]|uniref:odorant receptor 131-2-like n=1 Tax=Clarias gariepinus TaxID=13013 RepID=UPI00234C6C90|nr:odorant receptor 131-2-like [Clarias gariepinus]
MQSAGVNGNTTSNLLSDVTKHSFEKFLLLQILVVIFFYVNCLMILTFIKKEAFRDETRYVLFAQTLFVDTAFIFQAYLLAVDNYLQYPVNIFICSLCSLLQNFLTCCTPLTLVAMCLERYVAICMPLRHAEISTGRTRFYGLFIIWIISSIIPAFIFLGYWTAAPTAALFSSAVCSAESLISKDWQGHGRAALCVALFLFMVIITVFTYIKIMIAARAASSEKKKSTNKSLRTVLLHGVQLFLCMMQLFNPYIEMAYWKVEELTFRNVRYSNFIVFLFVPRSLSPLVYGVRDEKFCIVLKHYALCGTACHFQQCLKRKK